MTRFKSFYTFVAATFLLNGAPAHGMEPLPCPLPDLGPLHRNGENSWIEGAPAPRAVAVSPIPSERQGPVSPSTPETRKEARERIAQHHTRNMKSSISYILGPCNDENIASSPASTRLPASAAPIRRPSRPAPKPPKIPEYKHLIGKTHTVQRAPSKGSQDVNDGLGSVAAPSLPHQSEYMFHAPDFEEILCTGTVSALSLNATQPGATSQNPQISHNEAYAPKKASLTRRTKSDDVSDEEYTQPSSPQRKRAQQEHHIVPRISRSQTDALPHEIKDTVLVSLDDNAYWEARAIKHDRRRERERLNASSKASVSPKATQTITKPSVSHRLTVTQLKEKARTLKELTDMRAAALMLQTYVDVLTDASLSSTTRNDAVISMNAKTLDAFLNLCTDDQRRDLWHTLSGDAKQYLETTLSGARCRRFFQAA